MFTSDWPSNNKQQTFTKCTQPLGYEYMPLHDAITK